MSEAAKSKLKKVNVYRFNDSGMEDVDAAPDLSEAMRIREVEYDSNGHVIKETEFTDDEAVAEMFVRTYDDKGRLVEMQHFYEGELSEKTAYEYNTDGLVSSEILEYADGGKLLTRFTYDENGNVLEKKVTDDEGAQDSLELFTYEGKRLVESKKYGSEDNLKESRKLIYRGDDTGSLQEELTYDADTGIELRTVYLDNEAGSITYNKEGKVHTRQKLVYDEKKRVVETFVTTYSGNYHYRYGYDEMDNVVEETRTLGGTVFFKALTRYNEQGSPDLRSVTEMNTGLFTDAYRYEYYTDALPLR
jgi:YD repeat-containing protein